MIDKIFFTTLGLASVVGGVYMTKFIVSDIQITLVAVLVLGGLNLMKGCNCNNENNGEINGNTDDIHNAIK